MMFNEYGIDFNPETLKRLIEAAENEGYAVMSTTVERQAGDFEAPLVTIVLRQDEK